MPAERTKLTPPEVASRFGVSSDKVLAWIKSGELRAINAATRSAGRPRYLIDVADLAVFEARRAAAGRSGQQLPRRKNRSGHVIEFF